MGDFKQDAHARLFMHSLLGPGLPKHYTGADTSRVTLAYFCITGLDLLGKLSTCSKAERDDVRNWILAQQVFPIPGSSAAERGWRRCGFRGGSYGGIDATPLYFNKSSDEGNKDSVTNTGGENGPGQASPKGGPSVAESGARDMNEGHLAMTFSALATLSSLGDDLTSVDVMTTVQAMRFLQREDGSFRASVDDSTCDLRFTYCACAVSSILGDWSGVDRQKAMAYIERCFDFDGGIGLAEGRESCAGSTYCAVASMELMGTLGTLSTERREGLLEWCVERQVDGFQGRVNKPADTCCSFWVGATLVLLGELHLLDCARVRTFHVSCQNNVLGGFSKVPGMPPDLLHSFYSVCWLSLAEEPGVEKMDVALGVTRRTAARIRSRLKVVQYDEDRSPFK